MGIDLDSIKSIRKFGMKRIAAVLLLAAFSAAGPVSTRAQQMSVDQYQRWSQKQAKKQQKAFKKQTKDQKKAAKRQEKEQRKADRKAAKQQRKLAENYGKTQP